MYIDFEDKSFQSTSCTGNNNQTQNNQQKSETHKTPLRQQN